MKKKKKDISDIQCSSIEHKFIPSIVSSILKTGLRAFMINYS